MENLLEAKHPVLFYYNGINDRLLSLPTVRAFASLFPGRLKLICGRGGAEFFYSDLNVAEVCEIDFTRGSDEWTFDPRAAAEAVGECDLFINASEWHSNDLAELMARFPAAETVGFFRSYKRPCMLDDENKHAADATFDLPRLFKPDLRIEDFTQPLRLPSEVVEEARRLRAQIPPQFRLMVVQADSGWGDKSWPAERFVSVLDKFFERHPNYVAVVVDEKDYGLGAGKHSTNVIPCPGLPVATAWALAAEADLYFGIDSSLMHVADFARIPSVVLFGPAWPDRWERFGTRFGPHRRVSVYNGDAASEEDVSAALESLVAETQRPLTQSA